METAEFDKIFAERHPEAAGDTPPEGDDGAAASTSTTDEAGAAAQAAVEGQDNGEGGAPAGEAAPKGEAAQAGDDDDIAHLPDRERAQVRAARYGERQARRERDRLEKENEDLRRQVATAGKPAAAEAPANDDDADYQPDPVVIEQLAEVDPRAARELARSAELRAENARLKAQVKPAAEAQPAPEFVADEATDPDIKAAIEAVPVLNDWRLDAKAQHHWQRAKQIDGYLNGLPEWKGKPLAERFSEAVRLRKEEVARATGSTPKPKATAADAARIIAESATEAPLSVTDVRGRTPPTQITSRREAWKGMSNEEILEREFPG